MISSMLEPTSRFSKTVATGIRVSRNTHAPLRRSGTLSTAGHSDQSRAAIEQSSSSHGTPAWYRKIDAKQLLARDLLPAERAAIHRLIRTGGGAIDGDNDPPQVILNDAPLDRGQRDDCQPSPDEVLLRGNGPVA